MGDKSNPKLPPMRQPLKSLPDLGADEEWVAKLERIPPEQRHTHHAKMILAIASATTLAHREAKWAGDKVDALLRQQTEIDDARHKEFNATTAHLNAQDIAIRNMRRVDLKYVVMLVGVILSGLAALVTAFKH